MAVTQHRGCIKLDVDDSKYSSFVPVIGWYIAGISLVCLLAMVYDIYSAIRHKKRWLPCKLFSMNSFTLTLLAVASKLPVDLTTPIPSGFDQFFKLMGNGLICVSMGFLMPSLGTKSNHDSRTNMMSLSVFVVTLIVNTCFQIRSGIIFLFIAEHIIIMCCLLIMLFPLWMCIFYMFNKEYNEIDHNKNLLREGKGSMSQRLELAYLYGFNHDSQFRITSHFYENYNVSGLCLMCAVVLMQAAIRNLSLKFCGGSSEYGRSIWVIVLAQILIVRVGTSATVSRSWAFRGKIVGSQTNLLQYMLQSVMPFIRTLPLVLVHFTKILLAYMLGKQFTLVLALPILILVCAMILLSFFVISLSFVVFIGFYSLLSIAGAMLDMVSTRLKKEEHIDEESYENLIKDRGGMSLIYRGLLESVKDMKRWMGMRKIQPMNNLADLLLKTEPSRPFHTVKAPQVLILNDKLEASSLSLVMLVYIAKHSLPSDFSRALIQAYSEVWEVIHFLEGRMILNKSAAEDIWKLCSFPNDQEPEASQFELALVKLKHDAVEIETLRGTAMLAMIEFVEDKFVEDGYSRATQNESSDFIRQLFVDIIYRLLSQLPHALYNEVLQSSAKNFHECVKTSLEILLKIQ